MTRKTLLYSTVKWAAVVVLVLVISNEAQRRMVTRFCYTSPNTAQVMSQCVLCDYYQFPTTAMGCTGSTAISMNITTTQALCIINSCFAQVQQVPAMVGRKKRDTEKTDDQEEIRFSELVKRSFSKNDVYKVAKDIDAYLEADVEEDATFEM